ncbi:MAG TPA: formylglycine-generating enzyme family protein, partial [Gemmataceae bacterium]|nr:formylglycine-generating enzyme family protein [Gemmataceae bacterium]
LQRGIPVIPTLVSGAAMPVADPLPPSLQPLAFRNGLAVRRNPDFHRDVDRLLNSLDQWLRDRPNLAASQPAVPARPKEIVYSLRVKLVLVHAGTFWMGDRDSQTPVQIPRDFYMSSVPVTQEQWQAVMGNNPSHFARGGAGAGAVKGVSDAGLELFPVEQVSWEDAQEFIKRLNAREIKSGFLYRLPTEAEWEYSCRGGATSQSDCDFDFYFTQPTNDLSSDLANFDGRNPAGNAPKGKWLQSTTKVGAYQPNRLGIYDMHGNVWEWCEDPFEAGDSARVVRGGCWYNDGVDCRASERGWFVPPHRYINLGLRLAAVPSDE